jgi:hypothetical protein
MKHTRSIDELLAKLLPSAQFANAQGPLTKPRTWGVYELPDSRRRGRKFRFGNHPIRQQELQRAFGTARLVAIYGKRDLADALARELNS